MANIVSTPKNKFIKLIRYKKASTSDVFEITPMSLIKLVDGLSGGNVVKYIDYYTEPGVNVYGVSAPSSVNMMSEFLNENLSVQSRRDIFGNAKLDTANDFKIFFNFCKDYNISSVGKALHEYLDENFYLFEGKFIRRSTSHYINV